MVSPRMCHMAVVADGFPISMRAPVEQPPAEVYAEAMRLVEGRPAYRKWSWQEGATQRALHVGSWSKLA